MHRDEVFTLIKAAGVLRFYGLFKSARQVLIAIDARDLDNLTRPAFVEEGKKLARCEGVSL